MDEIATLLHERERQGLRWFLIALIAAATLWTVVGTVFITAPFSNLVGAASGLLDGTAMLLLSWALARRRSLTLIGVGSVLVAFSTIAPGPFMEWQDSGIDHVAAGYLIKTGLPAALVVCALSAITLQPRYPLMVTGLTLVHQLVLLAIAFDDPRTVSASRITWEEHVMGVAVHGGKVAHTLAMTVGAGICIALVAWVARRTVRRAVALEQANGQLRRYFSPEVAERIATAESGFLQPGGRMPAVVVLVSDLEEFTPPSHPLGPARTPTLPAD